MEHGGHQGVVELERVHQGFQTWRDEEFGARASVINRAAELLESRSGEFAELMAREMGKPVSQGRAEVEKCAKVCRYYAEHGAEMLADVPGEVATVSHQPLGPVLAVMPWNFPFWQAFRFLAPALMAGNTVLLKHASNVPGCAAAIVRLLATAAKRDDLLAAVFIPGRAVAGLIADLRVRAVTFTGSTEAGRKVAAAAAEHLKKSVLELGGSDPYLILDDADLELAARICANARMVNGGQSCIAAKRFLVASEIHDEFVERLAGQMNEFRFGDPLDPGTNLGPMARSDLRDELHAQVTSSIAAGAKLAIGGILPNDPKWATLPYYPATILSKVVPGMRVFDEETFGPVAAISAVGSDDEAVELANRTNFGLGAAVFSRDPKRAWGIAKRLEAGSVAINRQVVSDPRYPFGGIRDSGWGRELGSHGIMEFVNVKTVLHGEKSRPKADNSPVPTDFPNKI